MTVQLEQRLPRGHGGAQGNRRHRTCSQGRLDAGASLAANRRAVSIAHQREATSVGRPMVAIKQAGPALMPPARGV